MGGVVPLRLLGRAWFGRRRAVVIAGESLVWVALCRCESGGRRASVSGGQSLVWAALCRCDCWGELGLGGRVPLGLLGRAWSGWRCAVVIGLT